jgi:undecaprenyl diphosphate synthase
MPSQPKLPQHVAIIMDGNGRWAKRRGLPRSSGHRAGADVAQAITKACGEKGIAVLTLFAFGSENWRRPAEEVNFLLDLFTRALKRDSKTLHKNNVQLRIVGDTSAFDANLQKSILDAQQLTANNTGLKLVIAVNYSGRWDIVQATKKIVSEVADKQLTSEQITAELIRQKLCLADLPEPDLFIRTSGEKRISNFMLWQFAYTELFFTDTLWPDFTVAEFEQTLNDFANRERRFGLTSEQIA